MKLKKKLRRKAIYATSHPLLTDPTDTSDPANNNPIDDKAIFKTLEADPNAFGVKESYNIHVVGRISRLTPAKEYVILKSIHAGMSYAQAANLVGVPSTIFHSWKQKGLKALSEGDYGNRFGQFFLKLQKASSHAELAHVKVIDKIAKGGCKVIEVTKTVQIDPVTKKEIFISQKRLVKKSPPNYKASLEMLARRYPERWGRDTKFYDGNSGTNDPAEVARLIRTELSRLDSSVPSEPKCGDFEGEIENGDE